MTLIIKEKITDNLKYIIVIFVLLIIVGFIIFFYLKNYNKEIVVKENKNLLTKKEIKKEPVKEENYYFVDIKGAVKLPGVYKLKENSRIIDVINESGGLNDNADTSIINLSKKIFDEMVIIIYTKEEIDRYRSETISTKKINEKLNENIFTIDENNNANIKSGTKNKTNQNEESSEENKLVNINTASKEEFLSITGIGESKADAIILYRKENGNFEVIEDIKNVSGIGDSLFEKIKKYITV